MTILCNALCSCHDFFLHCVLTNYRALLYSPVSIALDVQGGANLELLDNVCVTTIRLDG